MLVVSASDISLADLGKRFEGSRLVGRDTLLKRVNTGMVKAEPIGKGETLELTDKLSTRTSAVRQPRGQKM